MGDMLHLGIPWYELVIRSIGIYTALLFGLRLFGKREVGQFTLFDLVFILLVANAVQPAMTGPDSSFLGGLIIIGSLLIANFIVGRLDDIPALHRLLAAAPTELVRDGSFVKDGMRREGVTEDEVLMSIREHGIEKIDAVKLAMLESDGSISVVSTDGNAHATRRRRRVRFLRH